MSAWACETHALAARLARLARELDEVASKIERLGPQSADAELMLSSAWGHVWVAVGLVQDVRDGKLTPAERGGSMSAPETAVCGSCGINPPERGLTTCAACNARNAREGRRAIWADRRRAP
jgi:hypothetical protein